MKLTHAVVLLGLGSALAAPAATASDEIAKKAGCNACHAMDKKLVGPSYKEIADKYKGQKDAVAKLSEKVRKGGVGVWGQMAMPPSDASRINDADLKAVMEWMLKS